MPFRTFTSWVFDGKKDSNIPTLKISNNKVVIPDITKYNSPISHTFVVSLFLRNGNVNKYLNKYLNNVGLRYISKQELFHFIKKIIQECHVRKYDLMYYERPEKNQLFDKLRDKLSLLKDDDISLLVEQITSSSTSASIYESLGLQVPKRKKIRKQKEETGPVSLKEFLRKNFELVRVSTKN